MSLLRIRSVPRGVAVVFASSGANALVVDNAAKLCREAKADRFRRAASPIPALPQWLVAERKPAIAAEQKSVGIEIRIVPAATAPMGVEAIDGATCDEVRVVRILGACGEETDVRRSGFGDAAGRQRSRTRRGHRRAGEGQFNMAPFALGTRLSGRDARPRITSPNGESCRRRRSVG